MLFYCSIILKHIKTNSNNMMHEKVGIIMNIAVVGAGIGGKKIIELFNDMDDITINIVIDKNFNSPGIIFAKENNIPYSKSIDDIKNNTDMIIEATGSNNVLELLESKFSPSIKIVDSAIAKMLMLVIDNQLQISEKLNDQLDLINTTTVKLKEEINQVTDCVKSLNNISTDLTNSSNESKQFISKTDDVINSVNRITNQIKILGLNANIEAARAGSQGKCFSVVASEIQKLSDTTSKFANEISTLLQSLSNENIKIEEEVSNLDELSSVQTNVSLNVNQIINSLVDTVK